MLGSNGLVTISSPKAGTSGGGGVRSGASSAIGGSESFAGSLRVAPLRATSLSEEPRSCAATVPTDEAHAKEASSSVEMRAREDMDLREPLKAESRWCGAVEVAASTRLEWGRDYDEESRRRQGR